MSEEEARRRIDGLPQAMAGRLFPFQREGIRMGVRSGGRCLLADEMVHFCPRCLCFLVEMLN